MTVQKVFARSEVKYLVSDKQRELIEHEMLRWMRPDEFGRSTVRSLYYDTPDHLLIRRSLAAPVYKEKLRLRSYKQASETSPVYAEIKKKFDGVVYKRRCRMTNAAAEAYLSGGWQDGPYKNEQEDNTLDAQVMKELHFMLSRYKTLAPAAFVSCEREAFYAVDDHEFRITFDDNILGRDTDLSLTEGIGGLKLLPDGQSLMEIKAGGAFPLWICRILTEEKIHKTSFSKYGNIYRRVIEPRQKIIFGIKNAGAAFFRSTERGDMTLKA